MYYYLDGTVSMILPNAAVMDCNGVGYQLSASLSTLSALRAGTRQRLFTYLHVREGAVELFGFADLKEKNCFTMLLDISGVGPKAALAILSVASPDKFAIAILNNDEKLLTRAQGVGKKLAQRILLELKDKIKKTMGEEFAITAEEISGQTPVETGGTTAAAAVSALMVLGYTRQEAQKAVSTVDALGLTTEEVIRQALKNT